MIMWIALGVFLLLAFFALTGNEWVHGLMLLWFLPSLVLFVLHIFGGLFPEPSSFLLNAVFLGLVVPFIYFVMAGINSTIDDVSRGVQKVNRHLDESHERWSEIQWHEGRQYIYDHERNEWYVFVAHVEQWKPLNPAV